MRSESQDPVISPEGQERDVPSEASSGSTRESPKLDRSESFVPIRSRNSGNSEQDAQGKELDDPYIARTLSHRKSHASGHEGAEWEQIERLISRMFGHERKANSEEEKTRHVGVVWKNLSVKGLGLGAALQPTTGDIFLGIPRFIKGFLTRGTKGNGGGKKEIRTILDDFTVCIELKMIRNWLIVVEGLCSTYRNASCSRPAWIRMLNIFEGNWKPKVRIREY